MGLAVLLFAAGSSLGSGSSITERPGPARVTAIVVDRSDPTIVYAASDGVFKSTDQGQTWFRSSIGLEDAAVDYLALDSFESSTLYAGTGVGVFRSTDAAASWKPVRTGMTNLIVTSLATHAGVPGKVYAATRGGLFVTSDRGDRWELASPKGTITCLAVDPTATETLYGCSGFAVIKSTNGGADWSSTDLGPVGPLPRSVAIDPLDPNHVLTAAANPAGRFMSSGGLFESQNGGQTWQHVLLENSAFIVVIDPVAQPIVNLATAIGIRRSPGWSLTTPLVIVSLAADPIDPNRLYVGSTSGLSYSTDGGAVWRKPLRDIGGISPPGVAKPGTRVVSRVP